MTWSGQTDFDLVCRRAAGRRRYNSKRREEARKRYKQVVEAIMPPDGRKRGSQAKLARALGVHRSTISRDFAKWRRALLDVIERLNAKDQLLSTSFNDSNSDLHLTLPESQERFDEQTHVEDVRATSWMRDTSVSG